MDSIPNQSERAPPPSRRARCISRTPGPIPNYDMVSLIDQGGFGDVWLALEKVTGAARAIKVLYKDQVERTQRDLEGIRRYQRCAHNHPHLIQILTVGESDTCFFYVMETADNALEGGGGDEYAGLTLRQLLTRRGRFDGRTALEWTDRITSAVSHLHAQSLGHHDLKPENILIVGGEPKIADVGLVGRMGGEPVRAGTAAYLTPEGHADDLYATGKVLYEMISGRSAADFPSLPPEILSDGSGETASAVQIANRLCHQDQRRRCADASKLAAELKRALQIKRSVRAKWQQLSRRRRIALIAGALGLGVVLSFGAFRLYAARFPIRLRIHQASLNLEAWSPAGAFPASARMNTEQQLPPIRLKGQPLAVCGGMVQPLPRPVRHFVVEGRFRGLRSWGNLVIGLSTDADGANGIECGFRGQPDGMGLYSSLQIRGMPLPDSGRLIYGHPQPGVDYVFRLIDCGETLTFQLWPLSRRSQTPLTESVPWRREGFTARYWVLGATADRFPDHVDLRELAITEYSAPIDPADLDPPPEIAGVPRPAFVPPPSARQAPPSIDLLADEFHPSRCAFWRPVGNWSWWTRRNSTSRWDIVRAVPFSTGMRMRAPDSHFEGHQLLRFDGWNYADFRATVHITLRSSDKRTTEPPDAFVSPSAQGTVGLAFRLQDTPLEGYAWGGGYFASLHLHPQEDEPALGIIRRQEGMAIDAEVPFAVGHFVEAPILLFQPATNTSYAEVFDSAGFDLTVEVRGETLRLLVNGQVIGEVRDGTYHRGRIGLYVNRLMATFESLHVEQLP